MLAFLTLVSILLGFLLFGLFFEITNGKIARCWIAVSLLFLLPVIIVAHMYFHLTSTFPDCFGEVEVRAYTQWDNIGSKWHDGRTATNKIIQTSDYSVAVSQDIETWIKGISNSKVIHVPGYNKPAEFSAMNDRSDFTQKSIEVLMTVPDKDGAQHRAREWGIKKGKLYRQKLDCGGYLYYIKFQKQE